MRLPDRDAQMPATQQFVEHMRDVFFLARITKLGWFFEKRDDVRRRIADLQLAADSADEPPIPEVGPVSPFARSGEIDTGPATNAPAN